MLKMGQFSEDLGTFSNIPSPLCSIEDAISRTDVLAVSLPDKSRSMKLYRYHKEQVIRIISLSITI